MDPYVLLNLPAEVNDEVVKEAYLNAARTYTPEHHPEMFEAIRIAYEMIKTERARLNYHLFDTDKVDPITVIYACLIQESSRLDPALARVTPSSQHIPSKNNDIAESGKQLIMEGVYSLIQNNLVNS